MLRQQQPRYSGTELRNPAGSVIEHACTVRCAQVLSLGTMRIIFSLALTSMIAVAQSQWSPYTSAVKIGMVIGETGTFDDQKLGGSPFSRGQVVDIRVSTLRCSTSAEVVLTSASLGFEITRLESEPQFQVPFQFSLLKSATVRGRAIWTGQIPFNGATFEFKNETIGDPSIGMVLRLSGEGPPGAQIECTVTSGGLQK